MAVLLLSIHDLVLGGFDQQTTGKTTFGMPTVVPCIGHYHKYCTVVTFPGLSTVVEFANDPTYIFERILLLYLFLCSRTAGLSVGWEKLVNDASNVVVWSCNIAQGIAQSCWNVVARVDMAASLE